MQEALRRKPFVNLTLTEEASLMDVTLHSGGGGHGTAATYTATVMATSTVMWSRSDKVPTHGHRRQLLDL